MRRNEKGEGRQEAREGDADWRRKNEKGGKREKEGGGRKETREEGY